jgi:hypothetical protein
MDRFLPRQELMDTIRERYPKIVIEQLVVNTPLRGRYIKTQRERNMKL